MERKIKASQNRGNIGESYLKGTKSEDLGKK